MRHVFVDSGGFFSAIVAEDPHHAHAAGLIQRAAAERWRLYTTNAVAYETYALLLARTRAGRSLGLQFLDRLATQAVTNERVSLDDEARAIAILRTHADKSYSYCDALSFVIMQRLRIAEVIAFDHHFREYGKFVIL